MSNYTLAGTKVLHPANVTIHVGRKYPKRYTAAETKTLVVPIFRDCEVCPKTIGPGEVAGLIKGVSHLYCEACYMEAKATNTNNNNKESN